MVIIESRNENYSAYSPDVSGCVSTGKTVEDTLKNMREALEFHLESLLEDGEEIPHPQGLAYYLENGEDISEDDVIAHLSIEIPESVFA